MMRNTAIIEHYFGNGMHCKNARQCQQILCAYWQYAQATWSKLMRPFLNWSQIEVNVQRNSSHSGWIWDKMDDATSETSIFCLRTVHMVASAATVAWKVLLKLKMEDNKMSLDHKQKFTSVSKSKLQMLFLVKCNLPSQHFSQVNKSIDNMTVHCIPKHHFQQKWYCLIASHWWPLHILRSWKGCNPCSCQSWCHCHRQKLKCIWQTWMKNHKRECSKRLHIKWKQKEKQRVLIAE